MIINRQTNNSNHLPLPSDGYSSLSKEENFML